MSSVCVGEWGVGRGGDVKKHRASAVCYPAPNTPRAPIEPSPILRLCHLLPLPSSRRAPGFHPPTLLLAQTRCSRPDPPSFPPDASSPSGTQCPSSPADPAGPRPLEGLPNWRGGALSNSSAPRAGARRSLQPPSQPGLSLLLPSAKPSRLASRSFPTYFLSSFPAPSLRLSAVYFRLSSYRRTYKSQAFIYAAPSAGNVFLTHHPFAQLMLTRPRV